MSREQIIDLMDYCVGREAIVNYSTKCGEVEIYGMITEIDFPTEDKMSIVIGFGNEAVVFEYEKFSYEKVKNEGTQIDLRSEDSTIMISLL